jgi:putative ABC transport system substrate-binding protein
LNKIIVPILSVVCVGLAIALVVVLVRGVGGQPQEPVEPAMEYTIGIAQLGTHDALNAAREGFIDQMAEEGFVEGENVDYIIRNAEFTSSDYATIAQYFVSVDVDLIFSIATPITQACADAVEGTDIPVIFAAVTDPVAAGFADNWTVPGGQVTGASDWADVGAQVKLGMDIYPAARLGVIYNAGEVNSVVQINELNKVKSSLNITEIVPATAATTADVYAAAMSLVGRVDAIWVPSDNTVAGAIQAVVAVCEDNDIPLFGSDISSIAKGGCISGEGLDYYVNGQEAAKLAAQVLEGEDPANIPISTTPMTIIYLCPAAAERMGVTIPQAVLDTATEVCGNQTQEL